MDDTAAPAPQRRVLIAGASRGIGLELAVQYAAEGWSVIAGCRQPASAITWLPAEVDVQALDVADANSVAGLAWQLDDVPLDLLVVCAGLYGPDTAHFLAPSDEAFDAVMHTNVLGPMRLLQAFAPSVLAARGRIVVMTSRMGALKTAHATTGLLYRASKAAANMVTKLAANEYGPRGATVVAMHPGWVRTDMGGAEAGLGVTEAVEQIRRSIEGLSPQDNGSFVDYTGRVLDW